MPSPLSPPHRLDREALAAAYRLVRAATEALCAPLAVEDYVIQTMPEVSPTKWHLAHTSWFFETFLLGRAWPRHRSRDERYATLFNSYYQAVGERHPRGQRGHLSRPTVAEVYEYRRAVDAAMEDFLTGSPGETLAEHAAVVEIGLQHEEQHQELILTDVKHVLASNPLAPSYRPSPPRPTGPAAALGWLPLPGGLVEVGHEGGGFAFDNEGPRHRVYLAPFALASRPVSAGEYLAFLADGGYARPELWLSDGWHARETHGWRAPLYWREAGGGWSIATLSGLRPVEEAEPVCHVSYYEADAYARWAGARLPREEEWELAAAGLAVAGNFVEEGFWHPVAATGDAPGPAQLFGDVWEWTASPYVPYPAYRPYAGALGEYNGKFMCNQLVLRGGSCATPARHVRASYRNFFPPEARWQFSGIRLARS